MEWCQHPNLRKKVSKELKKECAEDYNCAWIEAMDDMQTMCCKDDRDEKKCCIKKFNMAAFLKPENNYIQKGDGCHVFGTGTTATSNSGSISKTPFA